jgi:hypothetical protein
MRSTIFVAIAALVLLTVPAHAGRVGLVGNDTGGIIPWAPGVEPIMHAIAAEHCARYRKVPKITSVHRQYGDFIGFRCLFAPGYDPVATYRWYWRLPF